MNASIVDYHWDQFEISCKTELWPDRLKNDFTCFDDTTNKLGNSTDNLSCHYFVKCAWNLKSEKAPNSGGSSTSNTSQWESRIVGVIDLYVTPKYDLWNMNVSEVFTSLDETYLIPHYCSSTNRSVLVIQASYGVKLAVMVAAGTQPPAGPRLPGYSDWWHNYQQLRDTHRDANWAPLLTSYTYYSPQHSSIAR